MESAPPQSWTFAPPEAAGERPRLGDRWLWLLGTLLFAYAVMGRGAAYLGVPPLFVGEVVLMLGVLAVLFARRVPPLVLGTPAYVLLALMAWVSVRVVQGAPAYGLAAVRDGMVVGYGVFALLVAGLVVERPERLRDLLVRYRVLVVGVLTLAWGVYLVVRMAPDVLPTWPWADDVRVIETKPGDVLVHLAAVTAFLLLGWKRATPLWLALLVIGTSVLMVSNRGGMLAYLLAMTLFAFLKPKTARFGRLVYVGVLFVVVALAVDTSGLEINEGTRQLSVEQIWENLGSVFGQAETQALNDTAEWRLQWWSKIVGYTFGGEHFLAGKGFGINLASDDGFRVDDEESLRSPHNSHLTILARGGVPAFLLWLLVQGLWLREVLVARARARRAGQTAWVGFFALVATFWLAAHVNASFDVYLEGPMGGVWFWTVFGLGLAGARLQGTHPDLLSGLGPEAESPRGGPAFAWRKPS